MGDKLARRRHHMDLPPVARRFDPLEKAAHFDPLAVFPAGDRLIEGDLAGRRGGHGTEIMVMLERHRRLRTVAIRHALDGEVLLQPGRLDRRRPIADADAPREILQEEEIGSRQRPCHHARNCHPAPARGFGRGQLADLTDAFQHRRRRNPGLVTRGWRPELAVQGGLKNPLRSGDGHQTGHVDLGAEGQPLLLRGADDHLSRLVADDHRNAGFLELDVAADVNVASGSRLVESVDGRPRKVEVRLGGDRSENGEIALPSDKEFDHGLSARRVESSGIDPDQADETALPVRDRVRVVRFHPAGHRPAVDDQRQKHVVVIDQLLAVDIPVGRDDPSPPGAHLADLAIGVQRFDGLVIPQHLHRHPVRGQTFGRDDGAFDHHVLAGPHRRRGGCQLQIGADAVALEPGQPPERIVIAYAALDPQRMRDRFRFGRERPELRGVGDVFDRRGGGRGGERASAAPRQNRGAEKNRAQGRSPPIGRWGDFSWRVPE